MAVVTSGPSLQQLWSKSRAGARAGFGFRFQNAAATSAAVFCWSGRIAGVSVVPEGFDDFCIEGPDAITYVQAKSKINDNGSFSAVDLVSYFALPADKFAAIGGPKTTKRVILIDRPFAGGVYDDWQRSIGDTAIAEEMSSVLLERGVGHAVAQDFLRSTLITWSGPVESAVREIADKKGVPWAVATCCIHRLLDIMGSRADTNADVPYVQRVALTVGEVEVEIASVLSLIDFASIDSVLRKGIAEFINFGVPNKELDYYRGVSTQPGHVSAGLVFPRQALTSEVIEALFRSRRVLISGPSGAGKSAAALMAAFETRHAFRWIQLQKPSSDDREEIHRFLAAQSPREASPIVLYIDNATEEDMSAWNLALDASLRMPSVLLVVCARQENLATLPGRSHFAEVRPNLDDEFAEVMWRQLQRDEATTWASWKEPLELSKGLLLEYAHILTQGRRLSEVIDEQVVKRLSERRDEEFEILRVTSAATSIGATVSASLLAKRMSLSHADWARAFQRLLNEHLVRRVGDDEIGGLHELRSQCILQSCLRLVPGNVEDVRRDALDVVSANSLRAFAAAGVRLKQLDEESFVAAVVQRLRATPESSILIGALEGLKLATLERDAITFKEISEKHNVAPRFYFLVMIVMLLPNQKSGGVFETLEKIRDEFDSARAHDFRVELLSALSRDDFEVLVRDIGTFDQAYALLRSLAGLDVERWSVALQFLAQPIEGASIEELSSILSVATELSPSLGLVLVDKLGGATALLDRLYKGTTWALPPRMVRREDGSLELFADLLAVEEPLTTKADDTVYHYAARALALGQTAQHVTSRPIPITGEPLSQEYGYGLKSFNRKDNSSQASVTWYRLLLHAVAMRYAASSTTEAMQRRKDSIETAAKKFTLHADRRCRGRKLTNRQKVELEALNWLEDQFPAVPLEKPEVALGLLSHEASSHKANLTDPAGALITDVIPVCWRMYDTSIDTWLLAVAMEQIQKAVKNCRDDERWIYVGGAPTDALDKIEQHALKLREIFLATSRQVGIAASLVMMPESQSWTKGSAVEKAYRRARAQEDLRLCQIKLRVVEQFSDDQCRLEVASAPATSRIMSKWPEDELCLLAHCASEVEFLAWLERQTEELRAQSKELGALMLMPVLSGYVVTHWAFQIISSMGLVPAAEASERWVSSTTLPFFESESLKSFEVVVSNMVNLYAVQELLKNKVWLERELRFLEECKSKVQAALESLTDGLADDQSLLGEIMAFLERLNTLLLTPEPEGVPATKFAMNSLSAIVGASAGTEIQSNAIFEEIQRHLTAVRLVLIERDLAATSTKRPNGN